MIIQKHVAKIIMLSLLNPMLTDQTHRGKEKLDTG